MADDQVITINDKQYNLSTFTDQQKYFVRQIDSINVKLQNIQFELDQAQAAKTYFVNGLVTLLEPTDNVASQLADNVAA